MKRQVTASVMEDDDGRLSVMIMDSTACTPGYTHESVEAYRVDNVAPKDPMEWYATVAMLVEEALGMPGDAAATLARITATEREACHEGH